MTGRTILHLRLNRPPLALYGELFGVLADITPVVQALPPEAAVLDVTGALAYFQRDAAGIADLLATRLLARYGLTAAIGAGPTRSQWVRRFPQQIEQRPDGQLHPEVGFKRRVRGRGCSRPRRSAPGRSHGRSVDAGVGGWPW
ncbi:hypothetical protein GCM10010193_14310 [Kitasatospora atroaurantiaca]|uniref:hypothetical protein n=1 Tax=Kitasatospora atroaurantiaca TaxID=285545 RepID=UPI00119D2137|nr:hypothetical protein [Kitasatospora atroaurantiaca]